MAKMSVSIFYPCYNDWGTIGSMVLLTIDTAERLELDYDLTIVDDGSRSKTLAVLDEIEKQFPRVRIIRHEKNRGYGGALRTGFASATRDWIFYTDGDAQYDVRELELLVEKAGPGVDIVQGYTLQRHDPLHRIIIGRIYHWTVKVLFGIPVRDTDCDFRLIRRAVFDQIELVHNSGIICAEMMTKISRAGFRFVEAPVHHYERTYGKSQFFNFSRLVRTAIGLGKLWLTEVVFYRLRGRRAPDGKSAKP
ncbi:MAG: glycosyltransferase family 2 protein [Candidatus Hydrogenedentes bacterium]|nr:glycosyltransferase family 2 protein [Candidatus Hydrogenedentota bacterium]